MEALEEMLGEKMRPALCLRTFLAEYRAATIGEEDSIMFPPTAEEDIKDCMGTQGVNYFRAIRDRCSLSSIAKEDDPIISQFVPGETVTAVRTGWDVAPNAFKLKTVQKIFKAKDRSRLNPFQRSSEVHKFAPLPPFNHNMDLCEFYNELIITVRVYRPTRATHVGRTLERPVFAEEFQCLGSNFLTDLRDKISCVCNGKKFFDVSENPNAPVPKAEVDPGYFFITDTFYNDKRNPKNADYSEDIRRWIKKAPGLESLKFKTASMEKTQFIDLTVSLGFPQLYQHHGNCEHIFTISQVEILTSAAECKAIAQYPRLCSYGLYNTRQCQLCGLRHYAFIVIDSKMHMHNPAYVCRRCFISFHYVDGKKVGSFKAYRVNDDVEITQELDNNELQITDSELEEDDDVTELE